MMYFIANLSHRRLLVLLGLVVGFIFLYTSVGSTEQKSELTVVDDVDLERYLGTWYEIAHIPVWFQKGCTGGTTAEYTPLKEGFVNVVNRCCDKEGKVKEAKGRAWVVNKQHPAKLKVSFFSLFGLWLFGGKYWIIDLDENYRYSVIGHPNREIGWILSRTPTLPDEVLQGIAERLEAKGYDFSKFKMTNQTENNCTSPKQKNKVIDK